MVAEARTLLEWSYTPADFFETPQVLSEADYQLSAQNGLATAVLRVSQDPVPDALVASVKQRLETLLLARGVLLHRDHQVHLARTVQERADGSRTSAVQITAKARIVAAVKADAVVIDAQGRVKSDTKAERIAREKAWVDEVMAQAGNDPLVGQLLKSYGAAIRDPKDEFTHLYEIRDALCKNLGGEHAAMKRLSISDKRNKRFGELANAKEIRQSRHRGKFTGILRDATQDELDETRSIAREMILAFARTL